MNCNKKSFTLKNLNFYLLCMYTFLVPFYEEITPFNHLSHYIFIVLILVTLFNISIKLSFKYYTFILIIFITILLIVFSTLLSNFREETIFRLISIFQLYTLFFIFFFGLKKKTDAFFVLISFYAGLISFIIFLLFYYGIDGLNYAISNGNGFNNYLVHQNRLGFLSSLAFSFSLILFSIYKNFTFFSFSLFSLVLALLSSSRRAQVLILIAVLLLVFFLFLRSKHKVLISTLFLALSLPSFLYLINLIDIQQYLNLLYEELFDTSLELRLNALTFAYSIFLKYPFFGSGLFSFRFYFFESNGFYVASHNGYIERLSELGIFGSLFFYFPIFLALKKSFFFYLFTVEKSMKLTFSALIIFFLFILFGELTGSFIYEKYLYIFLSLSFFLFTIYDKKFIFNL
jgi:O-antigen ligase